MADDAPPKPRDVWIDLGNPEVDDPLDANTWVHRALVISAAEVVEELRELQRQLEECKVSPFGGDEDTERIERARLARRAELREIAAGMRALIPQARLREAEEIVRGDAAEIRSSTSGPVTEDVKNFPGSDRRSATKRGRPSKRSLL